MPSYVWTDNARRAWLEAAERAWCEGYEQGRAQGVVLRLLFWRGIEIPAHVHRRVRSTTDLDQLRTWRDRAYDVTDAAELFD
ncbi:hypothetical protein [Streptomyces albiflavescens]|uniref:hypothetical protein n=1 Tax=Streptomyces albiflavescens TaxID=1623582 RepID=UPI001E527B45|nr:hypothetical protein [Streptomyces albiflavescens]